MCQPAKDSWVQQESALVLGKGPAEKVTLDSASPFMQGGTVWFPCRVEQWFHAGWNSVVSMQGGTVVGQFLLQEDLIFMARELPEERGWEGQR